MIEILEIIKVFVIMFVLVDLTKFIGEVISSIGIPKNKVLGVIYLLGTYLLTCNKCSSFWGSLIMTGDLFIAAIIAITIEWTKKLEFKLKNKETEL